MRGEEARPATPFLLIFPGAVRCPIALQNLLLHQVSIFVGIFAIDQASQISKALQTEGVGVPEDTQFSLGALSSLLATDDENKGEQGDRQPANPTHFGQSTSKRERYCAPVESCPECYSPYSIRCSNHQFCPAHPLGY